MLNAFSARSRCSVTTPRPPSVSDVATKAPSAIAAAAVLSCFLRSRAPQAPLCARSASVSGCCRRSCAQQAPLWARSASVSGSEDAGSWLRVGAHVAARRVARAVHMRLWAADGPCPLDPWLASADHFRQGRGLRAAKRCLLSQHVLASVGGVACNGVVWAHCSVALITACARFLQSGKISCADMRLPMAAPKLAAPRHGMRGVQQGATAAKDAKAGKRNVTIARPEYGTHL